MSAPVVDVIVWDDLGAVAHVDGTRVRIRRTKYGARWLCDSHGSGRTPNLCEHTAALAATEADPSKRRAPARRAPERSTTP